MPPEKENSPPDTGCVRARGNLKGTCPTVKADKRRGVRLSNESLMAAVPSNEVHEITDKGTINQKAVVKARAKLAESLIKSQPPLTGSLSWRINP